MKKKHGQACSSWRSPSQSQTEWTLFGAHEATATCYVIWNFRKHRLYKVQDLFIRKMNRCSRTALGIQESFQCHTLMLGVREMGPCCIEAVRTYHEREGSCASSCQTHFVHSGECSCSAEEIRRCDFEIWWDCFICCWIAEAPIKSFKVCWSLLGTHVFEYAVRWCRSVPGVCILLSISS